MPAKNPVLFTIQNSVDQLSSTLSTSIFFCEMAAAETEVLTEVVPMAFTEVFEAVFEAAALAAEATVAPILVAAAATSASVLTTAGLVGIFVLLRFRLPETGLDFCSFSDLFNC